MSNKQLKKNDFLTNFPEGEATRNEIDTAMTEAGFEYLDSWLDFLIEHFENLGRIMKTTDEDGVESWERKTAKGGGGASRDAFKVIFDTDKEEFVVEHRTLEKDEQLDKDAGEAATKKAAIKRACQASFARYKAETAEIRALEETEESEDE